MSDPRLLAHRRPRRPHALLPARMHRLSRSCRLSLNLIGIGSSPHFSPNRVHWGPGSERIVLQPRFFSNS